MAIGSYLLGFALLLIVALFVGRPFLQGYSAGSETLSEREALQAQKEGLLEQIRVLDFEHETGKIPDEEHAEQRATLLQEATATLRALDNLTPGGAKNGALTPADRDIEAAIAAARHTPQRSASQPAAAGDAEIEAAVQQMRGQPPAGAAGSVSVEAPNGAPKPSSRFCAQCGNPRESVDKFCAYCGTQFA